MKIRIDSPTLFGSTLFTHITMLALLLTIILVGCKDISWRGQSPDTITAKDNIKSKSGSRRISDIAAINGLNAAPIEGIGMVTGLNGTGSNPSPSWQKDHLLEELNLRKDFQNPSVVLASPDTAMVLVKGMIPPGARKGDLIDLEIVLPPNSETESLEHGNLGNINLKPMAYLGRQVRQGKTLGTGSGTVMVDAVFESRQDQSNQIRGWIPGGGRLSENRDLSLVLRIEEIGPAVVSQVSSAINKRFTTYTADGRVGVAESKTDRLIALAVPDVYRYNIGRFVDVIMGMSWGETPDIRVNRLEELSAQMDDPARCGEAAVNLEGMGKEGVPALRRALMHPNTEVSFRAAEALAYIGEGDGLRVLKQAAVDKPALRWNALTAIACLPSIDATMALAELMGSDSAETRYGSFRALYARSPNDPMIKGETLPSGFYLHVVPGQNEPMVHVSRTRRPEIVIFNDEQTVSPNLVWVQSGMTITGDGNGTIRIVRYRKSGGEDVVTCSNRVSDLIRTLAATGSNYSTVVSMLRGLKQKQQLNSRLAVDALPQPKRNLEMANLANKTDSKGKSKNSPDSSEAESRGVFSKMKSMFSSRDGDK